MTTWRIPLYVPFDAEGCRLESDFLALQPGGKILILKTYVVREQAFQPGTGGIAISEGLPRSQFGWGGQDREVRLRC